MAYSFTALADADILHLYGQGVQSFGRVQAERYFACLKRCLDILDSQPLIAKERTEFHPPVRVHFFQAHVIVYTVREEGILIIRVLHGRQDWERLL